MAGLLPASWLKFDLTGTNLVFILPEDEGRKNWPQELRSAG